ncbi:MAG: hypothetical protein E6J45_13035 [Chloroflexi bacterium]|nr:MAG: hypothetical protein E6J45_13035 [Chloroflexota bacterium]
MEGVDKLSYFVNDIGNQASDALVWSLNPVTIVDMFKVQDLDSIRMRPGAKWIAEPSGVNMLEPPKESVVAGFGALQQLTTSLREFSEPAPLPVAGAGRSRGRALQTSVGMQLALAEAATPVRDVVEAIEDQVMIPLLRHMHALTMQCLDRDLVLQITGAEGAPLVEQRVTVADVVGEFEFRWLGSTNAQNQQVRAQQMINFLAMASRIPEPALAQDNVRLRLGNLLRAIWSEGMQLPNADRIIADRVKQTSIDPRIENDLFRLGRGADVPVSEADDDDQHLRAHRPMLEDPSLDPQAAALLEKHIRGHEAAKVAKQIMRMQQQAQLQGLQGAAQGRQPGGNGAGRMAQTSGLDDVYRSLPRTGA